VNQLRRERQAGHFVRIVLDTNVCESGPVWYAGPGR
jgi:hypothetical protein